MLSKSFENIDIIKTVDLINELTVMNFGEIHKHHSNLIDMNVNLTIFDVFHM